MQIGQVVRLRLRDLDGNVVYAYGAGTDEKPADDDEALDAARGKTVAKLTYLNGDDDTSGAARGPQVVEVYQPLVAQNGARIGVVELYLPYAPIAADIAAGQSAVTVVLSLGLLAVWAALLAVSVSVTRRLRREARLNAVLANNDQLTSLPNRSRFVELVNDRMTTLTSARHAVVAVLDIDRFKEINDTPRTRQRRSGDRHAVATVGRRTARR